MKIKVKYFGGLRNITEKDEEDLEINGKVSNLIKLLNKKYKKFKKEFNEDWYSILGNGIKLNLDSKLRKNVVFLPVISGG